VRKEYQLTRQSNKVAKQQGGGGQEVLEKGKQLGMMAKHQGPTTSKAKQQGTSNKS
jgi:hypothetical protein